MSNEIKVTVAQIKALFQLGQRNKDQDLQDMAFAALHGDRLAKACAAILATALVEEVL